MQEQKLKFIPWTFTSDISGVPYQKTHIGLFGVNSWQSGYLIHQFKIKFPNIWRSSKKGKGSNLTPTQLEQIIRFLNRFDVHMGATVITQSDWKLWRDHLPNRQYVKEKLVGISQYCLLEKATLPKKGYTVVMDEDSFMDYGKAVDTVGKLGKANKRYFQLSTSISKRQELLRFADFVAAAQRKVKASKLSDVEKYNHHGCLIDLRRVKRVF